MEQRDLHLILSGFGGQGLLFAGKVIAQAGLIDNREVSWLPSYGPEMRGGTANCSVVVEDDPIGSPLVTSPDQLIAMNLPSVTKFIDAVKPGGLVLIDSTMVPDVPERDDVTIFAIPATQLAEDNGIKGLANVILTGKLFKETHFCSEETLEAAMRSVIPASKQKMLQPNLDALAIGMKQ